MTDRITQPFNIVRSHNDAHVAETVNGKRVYRQEKIYIPLAERSFRTAPYDAHFLFYDSKAQGWTTFCTCGSPAVIVGYNVYKKDASPTSKDDDTIAGELMVCLHHAQYGKHLDGVG